jgi:Immunity protein 27
MIDPKEVILEGRWVANGPGLVPDAVEERIGRLTREHLVRIGESSSGWAILYRDPVDRRLWEVDYPQSPVHGGGPRRLRHIDRRGAEAKYPHAEWDEF